MKSDPKVSQGYSGFFDVAFNQTDTYVSCMFNRLYKMSGNVKVFYLLGTILMRTLATLPRFYLT